MHIREERGRGAVQREGDVSGKLSFRVSASFVKC